MGTKPYQQKLGAATRYCPQLSRLQGARIAFYALAAMFDSGLVANPVISPAM